MMMIMMMIATTTMTMSRFIPTPFVMQSKTSRLA